MKLSKVQIHNFRAIHDATFFAKDYGLLVGANNAGKSSVIDAIRAFYEKDGYKFKTGTDFPHVATKDSESWIDLSFSLTDEEHASLAEDYKLADRTLRVRKYFVTDRKMRDGKSASGTIFGYKLDGSISDEPFYGAKNVQSGKFGDLIYIPAISRVDEHAKLSGPSALRDLLSDIMSDVVEGGAAYTVFSKSVKTFSETVRNEKTGDDRSLSGFEMELNEMLKPWDSAFQLKFPTPTAPEIVKSMLGWDLLDLFHGKEQSIDYYGSGFQRHFIYSLIQLGARYTGKKASKKAKDFSPSLNLVLFEEPEAFLHPPQQEVLARNLALIARTENWQVLVATHSANFVSKNAQDIPAIVRLRRTDGVTHVHQIDGAVWENLIDANQVIAEIAKKYPKMEKKLHADDARPEMEAVKHFLWLNPDRSTIFFANHVLLVEGATEVALINRLIGLGKISGADCGLYVLDCLGKYNIHRFMNLLSRLGIYHSVIHDDDHAKDEHEDLNTLIVESANANLTKAITAVPGDIETLLAIPKAGADHRKPQHVLFLLETKQIADDKVRAFCDLVEQSLPH